jgi:hypothetical protein
VGHSVSAELTVVEALPGAFLLGAWQNFNAVVWLRAGTPEIVAQIDRGFRTRYDQLKAPMSTVHIVVAGVGPPDPAARTALVEMNDRWGHATACGAVVIERGGLMGIALRSAVTGIIIVAPKHYRVKVFDGFEQCAPWLAEQNARVTGTQLEASDLLELMYHARKIAK